MQRWFGCVLALEFLLMGRNRRSRVRICMSLILTIFCYSLIFLITSVSKSMEYVFKSYQTGKNKDRSCHQVFAEAFSSARKGQFETQALRKVRHREHSNTRKMNGKFRKWFRFSWIDYKRFGIVKGKKFPNNSNFLILPNLIEFGRRVPRSYHW